MNHTSEEEKPDLSIIFLCLQASDRISEIIKEFSKISWHYSFELILVCTPENRTNHISQLQLPPFVKALELEHCRGYGEAIHAGICNSTASVICWTDPYHHPGDVFLGFEMFLEQTDQDAHVIKGYRANLENHWSNKVMVSLSSLLLGCAFEDVHGNPKFVTRVLYEKLPFPPMDQSFDLWFLYQCHLLDINVLWFDTTPYSPPDSSYSSTALRDISQLCKLSLSYRNHKKNTTGELIRFLQSGIIVVLINYTFFLVSLYGLKLSPAASSTIGHYSGFTAGFFLHGKHSFATSISPAKFVRFCTMHLFSWLSSLTVLIFAIKAGTNAEIAQFFAIGTGAALNFFGYKYFVYPEKNTDLQDSC
jgi:putative flippase GtrA